MKRLIALTAASLLLCGAAAAQTPLPSTNRTPAPGSPAAGGAPTNYAQNTSEFLGTVAELDAFHREAAQLALSRSSSAEVQKYAREIMRDHTHGYAGLNNATTTKDRKVTPVAALKPEHRTLLMDLKGSGAAFDRKYIDFEMQALKEALGVLQAYASGGGDPKMRQAAAEAGTADNALMAQAQSLQKTRTARLN